MTTEQQKPDNFQIWAILSTVLCCLPLGIVAILKSNKVDNLWAMGKYEEAQAASKDAKMWTLIAAGCGLVGGFIYSIIVLIAALA